MVQLGRQHDGSRVFRVDDLARKENLSANFLLQILNELRRGGVVTSRRGKLGGYMLARPPEQITLRSIVDAIEGEALEFEGKPGGQSGARVEAAWKTVTQRYEDILTSMTLAEMMTCGEDGSMFYI